MSNDRTVASQRRMIEGYQKWNRSWKRRFAEWKLDHIDRESMLIVGIIVGAILASAIWGWGFHAMFLPMLLNT